MATVFMIIAFIIALAVHEFAHAWSAQLLGDNTARSSGRMTLNPLAHIDPFGTILLPALLILARFPVVFGWAKPVPVNPANFASPRKGMMITSAAGPIANFVAAGIFAVFLNAAVNGVLFFPELGLLFFYGVLINVVIGLFNLIPIPPLDGSNIVAGILPPAAAANYMKLSRYGFLILIALLYLGFFERVLRPLLALIMGFFVR